MLKSETSRTRASLGRKVNCVLRLIQQANFIMLPILFIDERCNQPLTHFPLPEGGENVEKIDLRRAVASSSEFTSLLFSSPPLLLCWRSHLARYSAAPVFHQQGAAMTSKEKNYSKGNV